MKTISYILAAGSQTRWLKDKGHYEYPVKQLVPIGDEPLITRTIRQSKARCETYVVTNDVRIGSIANCGVIIPEKSGSIVETLESTFATYGDAERIVILLGDVMFSPSAIDTIYRFDNRYMFFGNRQEIFALVFTDIKNIVLAVESIGGWMDKGRMKLWHFYRYLHNMEPDKHLIGSNFTFIKDITQDFDDWRQYDKYKSKK